MQTLLGVLWEQQREKRMATYIYKDQKQKERIRKDCEAHLLTCRSFGCRTCEDALRWLDEHSLIKEGGQGTSNESEDNKTGDWMDLATIEMTEEQIEREYERYADLNTRTARQIKTGLEALEAGLQVVDLREVVKSSMKRDYNETFPQIALAPVNKEGKTIWCDTDSDENRVTYTRSRTTLGESLKWTLYIAARPTSTYRKRSATVPAVPDHIRAQAGRKDLVLWEAEWKRPVPRDPALLEHVGGNLYIVKAVWDMTPLEQAVLA